MRVINSQEKLRIAGGEITPGYPSPEVQCINVKLMVAATRNQPGVDVSAAVMALINTCPMDFWDPGVTHEYVINGGWS